MRTLLATVAAVALTACGGKVGSLHVRALGPHGERDVALARATPGDATAERVRDGLSAGLARGGVPATDAPRPGAMLLRSRLLDESEEIAGGQALRGVGELAEGSVEKGIQLFQRGSRAFNASRVRLELVLYAPWREKPVGAAYWDGFAGDDPEETVRRAAEEAGEAMAREIAVQRERWFTRRIGDERLILTSTPNVLPPGEWLLSNDMALIFQVARSFGERLQVNLVAGALPIPVAGGVAAPAGAGVAGAVYAGVGVIGKLGLGLKYKALDEGPRWPGVAVAYDMVNVWGGALAGGGVFFLGRGVAAAGTMAGAAFNLQFNLFTLTASKHFRDWFQLGGGLYVVDNHNFIPQSSGFLIASSTSSGEPADRFPTVGVPWLSAEAAAGNHFRFMTEYFFTPGADWYLLGMRTLIYRTRFGLARTGHVALKLDTSLMFTRLRQEDGGRDLIVLPWLGVALNFR